MNFNPRSSENIKLLLLSSRHYSRLRVPQTNLLYISRDDSKKETGPENPTCILIKLYAIAAVTLAARQRIRTEMEYHVDRRLYIYIYICTERGFAVEGSNGARTDARETRGDKHRSRRRKEREGEGQRWREIKTERERGVETERKLLEVSGNWR